MVATWELRAAFARGLAAMYGREVPAYETLVEVTREVNAEVVGRDPEAAQRLGSVERVSAERHGAIRVGTPRELAQAARVFAAFGMHPVGFYDLRDAGPGAVPVVSTAFRPIDAVELARNPFRVFTSMLVVDDPRYFDDDTRARLQAFLGGRVLFPAELLALADRAAAEGGLPPDVADELLSRATAAFALSSIPVDRAWYDHLETISSVAADVGGVPTTHLNHLTPRVLDIDVLQARMRSRGIEMIDEIQGPPAWEGPDVLLRQTSFRALAEERVFRYPNGSVRMGALRVRFGEVEQRGIALTPRGRDLYDRMVAEADATGDAFTFVSPDEEGDLRAIERAVGRTLPRITVTGFNYDQAPSERFEVPIGERIAAIRARRGEDRKRAREKAERRAARETGQGHTAKAARPPAHDRTASPPARERSASPPVRERNAPPPPRERNASRPDASPTGAGRVRGAWTPSRAAEQPSRPRSPDGSPGGRQAVAGSGERARHGSAPSAQGSSEAPSGRRRRRRGRGPGGGRSPNA